MTMRKEKSWKIMMKATLKVTNKINSRITTNKSHMAKKSNSEVAAILTRAAAEDTTTTQARHTATEIVGTREINAGV